MAAFAELRQAVVDSIATDWDVETLTEVMWAALHGLTTLARGERVRPGVDNMPIELLVAQFEDSGSRLP